MSIIKNMSKPAPRIYRRFANAYIVVMIPSLTTAIQSFGLPDKTANRLMICLALSGALVKFIGMVIANGEEYVKSETNNNEPNP